MFNYPVTQSPDGDTVLVTFADVPEAISFGMHEDDALLNAIDALETGLSFYSNARKVLPVASFTRAGKNSASISVGMRQVGCVSSHGGSGNQVGGTRPSSRAEHAASRPTVEHGVTHPSLIRSRPLQMRWAGTTMFKWLDLKKHHAYVDVALISFCFNFKN